MKNGQPPDSRHRDRDHDRDHNHFTVRDVVASYDANAPTLAPGYEDLPFEEVHASVLDLLPDAGACVLDMGAGTGRDAAWFAANGYSELERHSCESRMRHVDVSAPGELLNQDTFYWGTLKGVGKIYVQVAVDAAA